MNQSHQHFDDESLKAITIEDDELAELLERLAASDAMFAKPIATIADVSEVTDASPVVIARILSQMRGPGDIDGILNRLDAHEDRLQAVEERIGSTQEETEVKETWSFSTDTIFVGAFLAIIVFVFIAFASNSFGPRDHSGMAACTPAQSDLTMYENGDVVRQVNGKDVPVTEEEAAQVVAQCGSILARSKR